MSQNKYLFFQFGILFSCILLAPLVVFLENQTFYIAQFGRSQTERGNYVDDDQVFIPQSISKQLIINY